MSKKWKTAAIHWENHSKKGSAVLAWRLKMQALSESRGLYGRMTSIKECLVTLLSPWQSEDSRTFSKKAAISIIKLTCNLFLFLGCGSHLANVTVNRAKAVLDTSLKISEHDNWYMPGSDAKHFWYVKDVVIPILLITRNFNMKVSAGLNTWRKYWTYYWKRIA